VPPKPVDLEGNGDQDRKETGQWHVPVVLDFHGTKPGHKAQNVEDAHG
jgi:hypothetical protein